MTLDRDKLREVAERAQGHWNATKVRTVDFELAFTPPAVLALLDEIEQLDDEVASLSEDLGNLSAT